MLSNSLDNLYTIYAIRPLNKDQIIIELIEKLF